MAANLPTARITARTTNLAEDMVAVEAGVEAGVEAAGEPLRLALMFPPEYLHTINPPGFALHELRLKVGIPIILLWNISPALGLANGTGLVIMHLSRSVIQAKILTGIHVGNMVCIPRILQTKLVLFYLAKYLKVYLQEFYLNMNTDTDDKTIPIQIRRRGFPVRPAFAMAINKSQGQTFQKIAI